MPTYRATHDVPDRVAIHKRTVVSDTKLASRDVRNEGRRRFGRIDVDVAVDPALLKFREAFVRGFRVLEGLLPGIGVDGWIVRKCSPRAATLKEASEIWPPRPRRHERSCRTSGQAGGRGAALQMS